MVNVGLRRFFLIMVLRCIVRARSVCGAVIVLGLFLAMSAQGEILYRNSDSVAENDATLAAWLDDIGITEDQIPYLVDFEVGFTEGQNVSGVAGLFPGGLVITDTGSAESAIIRSSASYFGGSYPVGVFSIAHNESQYLELDFSAAPVDYVSFQDIDHAGTTVYVDFVEGPSVSFGIETTRTSGTSAEFTGIFRNDMPMISKIRLDATGDT